MLYIIVFAVIINLIGFIAMGVDKRKAQKHRWRISEKDLFTIAALGGAIGIKLGMNTFHHKTLHKKFKLGIPFIILINLVLYGYGIFLINKLV